MARIRSIKPDFWTSAQVMDCQIAARLLFVGLWNFADDHGRMVYSPRRVKAQIFASDDFSANDIHGMILELYRKKLVLLYEIENTQYLQITGWHHQKISHPKESSLPPPPKNSSRKIPGAVREYSENDQGAFQRDLILSDLKESKPQLGSLEPPRPRELEAAAADEGKVLGKAKYDFDLIEKLCREAGGLGEDPSPSWFNLAPIIGLLDAGYDLEDEIIPPIRAVARTGRRGRSWAYYVTPIMEAKKQRTGTTNGAANGHTEPTKPLTPEQREDIDRRLVLLWKKTGIWHGSGADPHSPMCRIPKEKIKRWTGEADGRQITDDTRLEAPQ